MATDLTGVGQDNYDSARALKWDAQTSTRSLIADVNRDTRIGGWVGSGDVDKYQLDPRSRFGYPGVGEGAKGALYALDPDDHTRGDALYFSRYPTELTERIEALLASDSIPGRAYPAFQVMGAKGVQLSAEIWFCDAFMWSMQPDANDVLADALGLTDTIGLTSVRTVRPKTLAEQARKFFEFYLAGHDGTGVALPPVDMFLHWGGREYPVPIVIKSVDMRLADFTGPDTPNNELRGGAGTPQTVTVKLEMEVFHPLRAVNLFQPRKPQPPKPGKPRVKACITPGFFSDMTMVRALQAATAAAPIVSELIGQLERTRIGGFGPPRGAAP